MKLHDLKKNWEHTLVGDSYIYTFQAGSDAVLIRRRGDNGVGMLIPLEELCGVLDFSAEEILPERK